MEIEKKIKSLRLELPEAPRPVASYVPAVHSGNFVFTSGRLPVIKGDLKARGKKQRGTLPLKEGMNG
jgi:enamine deaminase RidA (YjgF/YER057c/UK114 family)